MAKGPGGKSAGRVSIRVVPDSTRFNADLKKSLDRIEKSTVLKIPLGIETKQAELSLRKFVKGWNGKQVSLDVDAKTLAAAAHLKEFTRPRIVPVNVQVSKASLAKAMTLIASLSGARVAGDLVKSMSTRLQNLDRSLPKIAAVLLAIGSIGAVALSSVGGLFTLAVGLSGIIGLAAPLAGILAGAAVGVGVLAVALSSAKTQLESLSPVWTDLKTLITDNFWAEAKQPIIDFVQGILPQLRAGLGPVSSALGAWASSVAGGFQKAFGGGVLEGMLGKLRESIDIASTGTGGFANAIATLGTFGASYLPRLATALATLANQFDAWLTKVAGDGSLARWTETGITVAKQLGSVLGSLAGIIGGIASAATAAGGGGMASFAATLASIAAAINSPEFQGTLTTLFQGAAAGVAGLASALSPIGSMLTALAPTLSILLSSIGSTVGIVMSRIADALAVPEFGDGLLALFQGISLGLQAITPSLPAVAAALGTVGQFAGALAAQLGPILGVALQILAPLVTQLLTAIQPLIPILGGVLLQAFQTLAPVIGQLVTAILPPLVAIITALLPVVTPLITLLGGLLTPIIQVLSPIISQLSAVFTQIMTALMPIITAILPPLVGLFQALMPVVSAVMDAVMALIMPILQLVAPLLDLIGPILGPLIQLLTMVVTMALQPLMAVLPILSSMFGGVASAIGAVLMPVITQITEVLGGLIDFITGVFTGNWEQAWNGIVRIFSGIWNGIVGVAKGVLNGLVDIINGMIGGVNSITAVVGIPKIPNIPHLAIGADIEPTLGGTAVVLGEGGKKETVTDYGRTNRLIELATALALRALRSGTSGAHIDAPVTINTQETDGRFIGRQAAREFKRALAG